MARPKKSSRPRRRARPSARKQRRLNNNVPEQASNSELYEITGMTSNTPYLDIEQNLRDYARASSIASNYQMFRIRQVKYTFKPRYDTFAASTTGDNGIPHLYYMVDRAGALPTNTGILQLKAMGAKPHRFDDKPIIVKYKPGVQLQGDAGTGFTGVGTKPMISPWLNTNQQPDQPNWVASVTNHLGLYWYLEANNLAGDGTYEYDCSVEVQFEFKKASFPSPVSQPVAVRAKTLRVGLVPDISGNTIVTDGGGIH